MKSTSNTRLSYNDLCILDAEQLATARLSHLSDPDLLHLLTVVSERYISGCTIYHEWHVSQDRVFNLLLDRMKPRHVKFSVEKCGSEVTINAVTGGSKSRPHPTKIKLGQMYCINAEARVSRCR
jgi:hypothetical protein